MPRQGDHIRARTDGRWDIRYSRPEDTAGNHQCTFAYDHGYQEAREKSGQGIETAANTSPCLEDVLCAWQESNRIRLKEASVSRYQNIIDDHILPDLGRLNTSRLTTAYLNKYIVFKLQNGRLDGTGGLSPSYVRSIAMVIEAAMKFAASENLCEPLRAPLAKPSPRKKEVLILSRAEQERLEHTLLTKMTEDKLLTYITLYTGLRIGEALALQWEDIDLSCRVLYVRHTVSRVWYKSDGKKYSRLVITPPKTSSSQRIIPLCSKLLEILSTFPYRKQTGYILTANGSFVSPRTFEYRYKKMLEKCGIMPLNFHVLRHTFATRCIEANVDVKTLSEIMGHSNASITLNTYVHPSIELKRIQLEKIV